MGLGARAAAVVLVAALPVLAAPDGGPPEDWPGPALDGGSRLLVTARSILHQEPAGRTVAEGAATARLDGLRLDADRLLVDAEGQRATAVGNVVLRSVEEGLLVARAEVMTVRLAGGQLREVFLLEGVAWSRTGVSAEALLEASPSAALSLGTTSLVFKGNHLVREDGRWMADDVEVVPCECNFDSPSFGIKAAHATLDQQEQRLSVTSASVWLKKVPLVGELPVFWFPWISLPTSSRQTGLLVPVPSSTRLNGFGLDVPVFITLGPSADVTLTPGLFTGGTGDFGVQGPRLLTEFRYAPAVGTSGRVNLGLLYDLRAQRDPGNASVRLPGDPPRGLRGELSLQHRTAAGPWTLVAEAAAHSDGSYFRDVTTDVIAAQAGYLRSVVSASHRGPWHLLTLDAVLRQDLTWGYPLWGQAGRALDTTPRLQGLPLGRLPALTFTVPSVVLAGPLAFDLSASAVRLAPLWGVTGDEGAAADEGRQRAGESVECQRLRLFWAGALPGTCGVTLADKAGQGDGVHQAGEREPRVRLDAVARLQVAATPGGLVSLSADAAWRQGLWLGETTGRASVRGYPVLGARAELDVSRRFGGVRHTITPRLEVRAVPFVWTEGSPIAAYDEVDLSLDVARARLQGVAEVRQRLVEPGGRELLRLELGQGVELLPVDGGPPRLAEAYGRLLASVWWLSAGAGLRVDPSQGFGVTRLWGRLALDAPQGFGGVVSYENLVDDGTNRARQPLDLLFGSPVALNASTTRAQLLTVGVRGRWGPFSARYDATFFDVTWRPSGTRAFSLTQHGLGVGWAPACDCFSLEVSAVQRLVEPRADAPGASQFYGVPDLGLRLNIWRFGSFGS